MSGESVEVRAFPGRGAYVVCGPQTAIHVQLNCLVFLRCVVSPVSVVELQCELIHRKFSHPRVDLGQVLYSGEFSFVQCNQLANT